MPVPSNHRTEPQLFNDTETISTNTDNRKTKDDINNNTNDISKIATSSRPKLNILRPNSPTFKRLAAVRIKLDKYLTSKLNTISVSRQSISETTNYEKQSTTNVCAPSSSSSQKPMKSKTNPDARPLDKITYEKTWTRNGNVKKKCSLEIWLPKPGSDDDEGNTGRTTSPEPYIIGNGSQSPQSIPIKSRRPSTIKLSGANNETKSLDETFSKKSEPIIMPRVYRYDEYLLDHPDERLRSSKSGNTIKSDDNGLNKNIKRQRERSHVRRLTPSTNNTEETGQSEPSGLPMTSKNLLSNIKQTYSGHETKGTLGSTNSSMIHDLIKKYSMIKKNHQELTQPKLQLEKPHHDSKYNGHVTKDHSLPSPAVSDSTLYTSSDHPIVSGRKLLGDTSSPQSVENNNNTTTKLIERRSSHHKPSYPDIYPQTRLFSLVNHLQNRQGSAYMPPEILPTVIGKKNEDPFRSFQRGKTLEAVFAVPTDNANKIPSRLVIRPESRQSIPNSSNLLQGKTNGNEQIPPRIYKRSLPPPSHTLRSEQQPHQISQPLVQLVQYQNIQNSAQRYHHPAQLSSTSTTTDVSTNKVLVHLKYSNSGNTDQNCLIPE